MLVRESFEKDLRHLQDEVLRMGSEVEDNLIVAVDALVKRNFDKSQQVIEADRWVNDLQIAVTMESLAIIATQQPAATDLRFLASVMNIVNELERIHDYIKGIGKISIMIGQEPIMPGIIEKFPLMAQKSRFMLHRSLSAFVNKDAMLAQAVAADDDEVDELFKEVQLVLTNALTQNLIPYEGVNRLDWANHNLERVADRVCNICEWVVYTATGKYVELA